MTQTTVVDTSSVAAETKGPCATPGSVGSSCSDDTPGETRSLTDEEEPDVLLEEMKHHNNSKDMTDDTEPYSSLLSSSPDDTASEGTPIRKDGTEAVTATNSNNNAEPGTPKFYRLNAFMRESTSDDDDFFKDGSGEDEENNGNDKNMGGDTQMDIQIAPRNVEDSFPKELRYEDMDIFKENNKKTEGPATGTISSTAVKTSKKSPKRRGVRFVNVCIREYDITIGDNPYCSYGVPICLDWKHGEEEVIPVDFFEASHKRRRTARRMLLNSFQRRDMLWRSGYPLEDIEKAIKENEREKFRRSLTLYFLPLFHIQEILYFGAEKCFKGKDNETQRVEGMVQKQQQLELEKIQVTADTEIGGMSVVKTYEEIHYEKQPRRLSFRSQASPSASASVGGASNSVANDWSIRSGSSYYSDLTHDRDDPYAASSNSRFKEYAVRVDRGQHDKATEIILCNLQRPHMRAFHAAWFSFFIAFFMWFAVTPLLGEVKDSLHLSKADIWTSSLCGTAGTIIMRILMGPACDKFGARICMAFILATSAIPCALTGLVQTSQGLSTVRSFVGIAGSSFVACQYWTSQMFTREVAGTANALVAGWGNLGGGVTQIVMGSALFPLFEIFFMHEDNDGPDDGTTSSELAWRTVFVVPTVVSLVTAYVIVYHCDDSPKGDYRERVRQQEIMVVSPTASLCAACQNWNVWILLIQYACCFGVEVTMTNATALYFREEFGQSTVSAAAIASVFGFMNLFARGLGGFGSDLFNAKYGMRGRMTWQTLTLFVEGVAVVIFGFADTMGGSIIALVFLSFMVQSAEGSTFGIVPYVDRRFTGSVVGWVGAGGNVGGACFSILFIRFDYQKAFALMGIMASCSAVLSCFMNCKKLTKNAVALVEDKKEEDVLHHNEAIGITKNTAITFAQLEGHGEGHK